MSNVLPFGGGQTVQFDNKIFLEYVDEEKNKYLSAFKTMSSFMMKRVFK